MNNCESCDAVLGESQGFTCTYCNVRFCRDCMAYHLWEMDEDDEDRDEDEDED